MSDRTVSGTCGFSFSGIGIRLRGLPRDLSTRLTDDWRPFVADPGDGPFLTVDVRVDGEPGDAAAPFRPKAMRADFEGVVAAFSMPEGEVRVESHGAATLALRRFTDGREYFTLQNLLRAALAWCLPDRGGLLVHAAGLEIDGRGFLLIGAEGSGKTTWARLGEDAGAQVISDDLVVVDGIGPRPELLGSPFKSTYRGALAPGRRPLAALLFPAHGEPPRISPVPALISRGRLVANLPFVAEAIERDARVHGAAERLCAGVPCLDLTFARDTRFVDILRAVEP